MDQEAGAGLLHARRGRASYELGEWTRAAADHARAIALGDQTEAIWFRHAWLRLAVGDVEGYRRSCTTLLQRFGKTENPQDASTLAWVCVRTPEAVGDWTLPLQLAQQGVAASLQLTQQGFAASPDEDHSSRNTLGAAHYRAGQFAQAIQRLNEAMQAHGEGGTAFDWLFLAMA